MYLIRSPRSNSIAPFTGESCSVSYSHRRHLLTSAGAFCCNKNLPTRQSGQGGWKEDHVSVAPHRAQHATCIRLPAPAKDRPGPPATQHSAHPATGRPPEAPEPRTLGSTGNARAKPSMQLKVRQRLRALAHPPSCRTGALPHAGSTLAAPLPHLGPRRAPTPGTAVPETSAARWREGGAL